ncbi:MAG TPA: CHAT domain-containing protein [Planctomycetota bacterium]|nr:CHAT domain-containing protein [Planctomycetota bacterium]
MAARHAMQGMLLAASLLLALVLPQDREDALAAARAAVAAAEQQFGVDSVEVSEQLVKLCNQLANARRFDEALAAAERVLVIREAKLPPGHTRIGIALANVATMHVERDDLELAIPLLERARDLLARNAPSRAMLGTLSNLGTCQAKLGDYASAQATMQAAVAYGREHAPDHPMLASVLQNLAQVRLNQGFVEEARALVDETLRIFEMVAPGSVGHIHATYGLGHVLLGAERLDDAEPLLRAAFAMETKRSPDSVMAATIEASLGRLMTMRGDLPAAKQHLEHAIAVAEAASAGQRVLAMRIQLAAALEEQGDNDAALAESSRCIAEETVQRDRVAHLSMWVLHGQLLELCGHHEQAAAVLRETLDRAGAAGLSSLASVQAGRRVLAASLHALGDVAGAMAELRANLDDFDRMLARMLPALSESNRLAVVQRQRTQLDVLLQWSAERPDLCPPALAYRHVLAWKGQVARGMQEQLVVARADEQGIAQLRRLQQIEDELAGDRSDIATLRERDRLIALVSRSTSVRAHVDVEAVQRALPENDVLVDYLVTAPPPAERSYVAFVVRRDSVQRFDLGPASAVERAVGAHVQLASRCVRPGAADLLRRVGLAARERVFDALHESVAGCRTVWLSPDDVLATLPFETLPGPTPGTFLVESVDLRYLQNAWDLCQPGLPASTPRLLAFGDIDYGAAPAQPLASRGVPRPFAALPNTRRELQQLAACCGDVPVVLVRGAEANEARLRREVPAATFVHLATHGFCGLEPGDGVVAAGIAMAGANLPAGADDGILTADEARLLDLTKCRMVVLSACQTGLGTPFAGESLLGLRRSMRIAGARTTVTSLWRVDDDATAKLMADFYRELFTTHCDPAVALRAAQLRALGNARAETGEALPGLWGAFVCEGR